MNRKTMKQLLSALLSSLCLIILPACDNDKYEPINTSLEACQINLICIQENTGKDLLSNPQFIEGLSISGSESGSKIKFEINHSGHNRSICFLAELPDQKNMRWEKDNREANGISRITIKCNKQKVELKCLIKYIANRPPAIAGGKATLEEVTFNNKTFRRSGNNVTITLRMNAQGKFL